ncbi:restriction endonuclease subunit S [[Leptolyngbya] sp. PCC 7376]|uniref:restriction endonuclease subunit S n=1 Tax=[Leptolyngbya] sp. PCC 7376 TaxID=111781 RepID=UPI001CEC38D9|nr:restriction endonuclease subunit S [[Leptolyngbya] sp. PCC 7376]
MCCKGYVYFADNDVLLAKITPCFENGKLGIARNLKNGVGFGSSEYVVFRSKGEIDPEYLFYFLSQDCFRIEGARVMSGAVGHKRVPKEFIENYLIPVPPLEEQKQIVNILDEVFEVIALVEDNTKRNLANADELFESYLNKIFTEKEDEWIEEKLGTIADFRNGLNFTKSSRGEVIKIVGVKDFQNHFFIQDNQLESVTIDSTIKEIDILKEGDILTVRSNGNKELIGRCILANKLTEKTSHSWFTIRIKITKDNVFPQFSVYFLKSSKLRKKLTESGGGINISSLNQKSLSLLELTFPSLEKQKVIVEQIKQLSIETQKLESIYQRKLEVLAELKQSILT